MERGDRMQIKQAASSKQKSLHYINVLNVLACLCVVGLHCNGIAHIYSNERYWYESFVVEVVAYWAVPVFFMISGATLMNYRQRYSTKEFLKRRFCRTGIPLLVWICLFLLRDVLNGDYHRFNRVGVLNLLMYFDVQNVYWFFAPLFAVYLTIPVLSKLKEDRALLKYMAAMGILTVSVLPFVLNALGGSFNAELSFPLTGGYVMYVILGYLLSTTEVTPRCRWVIYGLGIIGVLVRYFHTAIGALETGNLVTQTWGYKNWPCLLLSVAIFVFIKQICTKPWMNHHKLVKMFNYLSGASFGIYLIHAYLMGVVMNRLGIWGGALQWRCLFPFGIYLICLCIVKLLQKVPLVGKYLFP